MPNIYVIRVRLASAPLAAYVGENAVPIYLAIQREGQGTEYTTDKAQAQCFSSLFSADSYALFLDHSNSMYAHDVAVY